MWGAPYEPGYHVLDGLRAALSYEAPRPVADGADRPVGLLGRRSGQRVGRRGERLVRARAEHRRRGARIARRRPRPHLPPAQRHASIPGCPRWWWPRCRTSIPTSTRSSRSTPPTRARRCCCGCEKMTTAHAVLRLIKHGHGRPGRPAARADPRHARGAARLRRHQAGHGGADPAGADRAGGARPDRSRSTTSTSWPTRTSPAAPR